MELFVERAQTASPRFRLTDGNAAAVVEICRRLDGLPLAIELAAARSRILDPEALLERLGRRLPLLTSTDRAVTPRHQTMRNAIHWSYDLLTVSEQVLFRRLSVFSGGFTLEAVEQVCGGAGVSTGEVGRELESLLDSNLVRETSDGSAEARLEMLETTREFAWEVLEEAGEAPVLHAAHADYFHAFAVGVYPVSFGAPRYEDVARLAREHDNLRMAHDWLIERGEEGKALRMGNAMWVFWQNRGFREEGRRRLAAALALPGVPVSAERAEALYAMGVLAYYQGEYVEARTLQERSAAMWRALGGRLGLAYALSNLGVAEVMLRNYASATRFLEDSRALFTELGEAHGVAMSLVKLGCLATERCEYAPARAFFEEGLTIWRGLRQRWGMAKALQWQADVALAQGDCEGARASCQESLEISRGTGDLDEVGYALQTLGRIELERGDPTRARALLGEALSLQRQIDDRRGQALALLGLGETAAGKDPEEAESSALESLDVFRGIGDRRGVASALRLLGDVAAATEVTSRAANRYRQSLELHSGLDDRRGMAECFEGLARVAADETRIERAAILLSAAGAMRREIGSDVPRSRQEEHGQLLRRLRDGLSGVAFESAWAQGEVLPRERAVAFALGESQAVSALPAPGNGSPVAHVP